MLSSTSMAASLATTFLTLLLALPTYALDGAQKPTLLACYSSSQGLTFSNTSIYQSSGLCQGFCYPLGDAVMAMTGGTDCYCGSQMPPLSSKVDPSYCNSSCGGWPTDNCGSASGASPVYYAVWNSGLQTSIANANPSSTSSSTASSTISSTPVAVSTVSGGQTIFVTATPTGSAGSGNSNSSSGPSVAGIAAGVVVGVIAIAAIAGGIWFFLRAKARREVEEEYKRQASVNAFMSGGNPGSSGSHPDARLDPVIMTQRRMSDGSIMDNQDYSRRILKVTNA